MRNILVLIFICMIFVVHVRASEKCIGEISSSIMYEKFDLCYATRINDVWKFFAMNSKKINDSACNTSEISKFMMLFTKGAGNVEFDEYAHGYIEKIFNVNPECALKSLVMNDEVVIKNVYRRIDKPIFNNRDKLNANIIKYCNDDRFSYVVDIMGVCNKRKRGQTENIWGQYTDNANIDS